MAIKHVVRCDGADCGQEAPLTASAGTPWNYSVPSEWKQVDDRQFCSWACLGQYAEAAQKRGKR